MIAIPMQAIYSAMTSIAEIVDRTGIERDRVYRVDDNCLSMREALDIVQFNANIKARTDGTIQVDDSVINVVKQLTQCVTQLQEAVLVGQ